MHLINRLKTIHLAASLAKIVATILFLGVATPAFAERINECEPLFDSSNAEVMTSPELGTVSLDSATAKVEPRSSSPPTSSLRTVACDRSNFQNGLFQPVQRIQNLKPQ